ncbi:MAG: hypothetical protein MN733_38825, partial [Nitrososphaera sp.]|nr:hypothetical protein [Nitrososphaera sp.]
QLEENRRTLEPTAPYPFSGCGDVRLGRLCYLVCRALKAIMSVASRARIGHLPIVAHKQRFTASADSLLNLPSSGTYW